MRMYGKRERLTEMIAFVERTRHSDVLAQLKKLDPNTHTETAFVTVVGEFWYKSRHITCEECGQDSETVMEFGSGTCDDCGGVVYVCAPCLANALAALHSR